MRRFVFIIIIILCQTGASAGEVLVFKSQKDSLICKLEITYKTPKIIDAVFSVYSDSGGKLFEKRCTAKQYPGTYESDLLIDFAPDAFTCSFDCPLTIFLERGSKIRVVLQDDGCFAGEEISPAEFAVFTREFIPEPEGEN